MFYLNNNNIEEMFREAAEKYRLPADAAFDWERIERNLADEKSKATALLQQKKRRKRRFLICCLLLIPLGWFANMWYNHAENKTDQKMVASRMVQQNEKQKNIIENSYGALDNNKSNHSRTPSVQIKRENAPIVRDISNLDVQSKNSFHFTIGYIVLPNKKTNTKNNAVANGINKLKAMDTQQINQTKKTEPLINTTSLKTITINKQSGLYAGLIFSPDISFVRFQRVTGIGTSFGVIAGYRFNNRWSIEAGLLSGKKKYYTKGNYFDKQNEAYLLGKELLYVDGNCKMIEIPVNARYTFLEQKKGKWTASVGISSYFIGKEFYRYALIENGQMEQSEHTYYHSDHHTTTVLSFGTGYEQSIGSALQLRIEPYYKLPVSSMGKGKLYLSSAGINIGITKNFR